MRRVAFQVQLLLFVTQADARSVTTRWFNGLFDRALTASSLRRTASQPTFLDRAATEKKSIPFAIPSASFSWKAVPSRAIASQRNSRCAPWRQRQLRRLQAAASNESGSRDPGFWDAAGCQEAGKAPMEAAVAPDEYEDSDGSLRPQGPKPPKCYHNLGFLDSAEGRMIRIMCELQQPGQQLEKEGVENVVMFFGSARAKSREEYDVAMAEAQSQVSANPYDEQKRRDLERLKKTAFLVPCYEEVKELAGKLTRWNIERQPGTRKFKPTYTVGTGGGPGMMRAANEGAHAAGGKSCGFGIFLPFEDSLNAYCSPELSFNFHYFFTRKFWMSYKIMGLVVAPGGLGTCDELFEVMTLKQTGRIKRNLPIVLIGKQFWENCINFKGFVDYGMISQADYESLSLVDTAEEAFTILRKGIETLESEGKGTSAYNSLRP